MIKMGQLFQGDVVAGCALPIVSLPVTFEVLSSAPFSMWDFQNGDQPDYPRPVCEQDVALNGLTLQNLTDRIIRRWAGPSTFIARRHLVVRGSVCLGDTLSAAGQVNHVRNRGANVDITLWLRTQAKSVGKADTTIILPVRAERGSAAYRP